jgi:hypothetical protein
MTVLHDLDRPLPSLGGRPGIVVAKRGAPPIDRGRAFGEQFVLGQARGLPRDAELVETASRHDRGPNAIQYIQVAEPIA